MATASRTLTLKLLADIDNFQKNLAKADNDTSGFSKQVEKFGAAAKAAFAAAAAAAGAYAIKLGVDGVKAAIEDEQAQASLARTLQAATGATNAQIAATEKYISKMQLATGVADTDLRSALSRLSLSTNDLTKSQELLSLALDISKARQIPLETVANALGKAYDGQTTSLVKLGIGLSATELKGKSFTDVQQRLSDLFGGAAAKNADTFQGKIDIMRQRFAEFQESIGNAVIPVLMNLFKFIDANLIPAFTWLKTNAIDPVAAAIDRNKESFQAFGEILAKYVIPLIGGSLAAALKLVANLAATVIDVIGKVAQGIVVLVNGAIAGINALITAYNAIPFLPNVSTIPKVSAPSISIPKVSTSATTGGSSGISIPSVPTGITAGTGGGSTNIAASNAATTTGVNGIFNPAGVRAGDERGNIIVNVSGAIDPEGTARTIVNTLNSSFYRGTGGAEGLVYAL
jgi:hypothetical protein